MPTYSAITNQVFVQGALAKTQATFLSAPSAASGRTSQGMQNRPGLQRILTLRSQASPLTAGQLARVAAVATLNMSATLARGGSGGSVSVRPSVGLLWPRPARTTTSA